MTYTPQADSSFNPTIAGNGALWPALIVNDAACFEEYSPGLEANPAPAASALAREFRFRWWGNLDNAQLAVAVRAVGVTGPHTVTLATPGVDSDTASVSTDQWYSVNLDARGPTQEVIVSNAALGGGTLRYSGIRAYLNLAAPVAGTLYPSGFRKVGTVWGTSGYPIPSEVQSRIRTNPIRLAKDRPVCVAAHIVDTVKAVTVKSRDVWGVYDLNRYDLAGRLKVHADRGERWYRVDAYTNETTPGTAAYSVRIGNGAPENWSGPGWHSWRLRLGGGPLDITAMCNPGLGNGAAIRSLLVWRTEL